MQPMFIPQNFTSVQLYKVPWYYYFSYKENSIHVAETAKALANAYSNTGDEDAEGKK